MAGRKASNAPLVTRQQVSAGGVAFRLRRSEPQVVIVAVGDEARWQIPKGLVDAGESPEAAALREVREEAGIETELLAPIGTIDYWYISDQSGERVRYHKFVHFFLLRYLRGDVRHHDHEVREARWVTVEEAVKMLAFKGEREVMIKAGRLIESLQ
ncbi:MAG TPA: NUDIX domain-containing protein [Blastocatellia bacterium]|nr:NUDIX domain-containing protein [Blastocatellia bacterium]